MNKQVEMLNAMRLATSGESSASIVAARSSAVVAFYANCAVREEVTDDERKS